MRMGNKTLAILLLLCAALALAAPSALAGDPPPGVFSTWEGFEPDKLATIWLIKRYVNPDARFEFYPKGESQMEGVPFDTPYSKFRRYHNMSTYVTVLHHFKIEDPRLTYLGHIIDDVEVNVWERKKYKESMPLKNDILQIMQKNGGNETVIQNSLTYFDNLLPTLEPPKE